MSAAYGAELPGREVVLAAATAVRAPGRAIGAPAPMGAADAYLAAARQLDELLGRLSPDEWSRPAHDEIGTVAEVIAHLTGVERLGVAWLLAPPDEPLVETSHLPASRAAMDELAGADGETLRRAWYDAALQFHAAAVDADPAKPVLAHDLPTDPDGLLVLRAFELWAHLLDVCRATGRPAPAVEPARLALMSTRLMGVLPIAVALRASPAAGRVRFVLTGPAGGCFDTEVGEDPTATAETTIVADTDAVCRVAARRLHPWALAAHVEGDPVLAGQVLDALDAFARD